MSYVNANDGTCEGIRYTDIPAFTVQFHPEACGGPHDTNFLFDEFTALIGRPQGVRGARQWKSSLQKCTAAATTISTSTCFKTPAFDFEKAAVALSDRHFGIGGDGVICICPSETADAKMRMFNADGSEGKMCGNGVRCVGKYVYDSGIARKDTVTIETLSGIKTLRMKIENGKAVAATVDMGAPVLTPKEIPADFPGERGRLGPAYRRREGI